jgi:tetratricopeptide (TPR) repeat protein
MPRNPAQQNDSSPRESLTPQGESERQARAHKRGALIVLLPVVLGIGGYLWVSRSQDAPDVAVHDDVVEPEDVVVLDDDVVRDEAAAPNVVVVPKNMDGLDLQVRAYLEEQIERVRQAPDEASRHATLGIAYGANGLWLEARDSYRMVLMLDPDEVLAKYHAAVATQQLSDYTGTIAMLQEIVEEHPDFAPARHRLGALLLDSGSIEAAEAELQQAVTLAPDMPHGYIGLAEVALRNRDHEHAVELLEQALRRAPRNKMAHYLLGSAYRYMGRRDDAKRELKFGADAKRRYIPTEWSKKVPDHAKGMPFQIRQAQRYSKRGQYDKAIEVLSTALQWHPESVEALNDLAIVYLERRQLDKARELLERAVQADETNTATYINLAACYLDMGQPVEALRQIDRSVELAPNIAQAHVTRATVLLRLQRVAEAAEALEKAGQLDPQNPTLHMDLANTFRKLGRYADAKKHYETVVAQTPRSIEAQVGLCGVSIRLRDLDQAATALAAVRRLAPNHPRVKTLTARLERVKNR